MMREFPDWLRSRALSVPDRIALIVGKNRWTFARLDAAADYAARQLAVGAHPSAISEVSPGGLSNTTRSARPANQAVVQKPIQASTRHATPPGAVAAYSDPFPGAHAVTNMAGAATQRPPAMPGMSAPTAVGHLKPPKPMSALTSVAGKLPRLGALHG